jgi:CheY-like chemotaxis protein
MIVLVVDDQREYRLMLKEVLTAHGWDVFTAEDGEEALNIVPRIRADVVVTDIYMPVVDGFRLRDSLRKTPGYEKLPIVFVSGYDDDATRNAVKDPRYEVFLRKTGSAEDLVHSIKSLTSPRDESGFHVPPG